MEGFSASTLRLDAQLGREGVSALRKLSQMATSMAPADPGYSGRIQAHSQMVADPSSATARRLHSLRAHDRDSFSPAAASGPFAGATRGLASRSSSSSGSFSIASSHDMLSDMAPIGGRRKDVVQGGVGYDAREKGLKSSTSLGGGGGQQRRAEIGLHHTRSEELAPGRALGSQVRCSTAALTILLSAI